MTFRFKPLVVLLAAALTGCAQLKPMDLKEGTPSSVESAQQAAAMSESWNDLPVLTEGRSSVVLMTPYAIPDAVRNRKVATELEPGATVKDVVAILGNLGIPVIVSDEEAANRTFYLPHFKGNVGGLLAAVTRATDVWFTWQDGTVIVSPTERIGVSVPQESGFADQLTKGLDAIGIKDKGVSWQAGMSVMDITPSQFRKARTLIERLTSNAAIINLQLAVVNVTLNQSAKQGVDWEKMSLSVLKGGNVNDLKNWQNAVTNATSTSDGLTSNLNTTTNTSTTSTTGTTTGTTTGSTTDTASTDAATKLLKSVGSLSLSGGALQGALFGQRFSFTGLFNFLQTYGQAETKQNVLLKAVGGNKVEFKSLTQIPYVSEIGVTTTSNTTTNTNGSLGNALGSTKTEKADDGITVEMTPMFDSAANTVTVDLKLSIKAVIAFNELSAGNQLGKLTQPTTADRSFNDTLRLRPGQTVVVGGLTYDSVSDNRGSPTFLAGTKAESQSLTVSRQTMFIVLRPTVTKLGQVLQNESGESGNTLDLLPAATYKAEPEAVPPTKVKAKSKAKAKGKTQEAAPASEEE
jgi:type II secretory pathway component GspD/PulD (secretin)